MEISDDILKEPIEQIESSQEIEKPTANYDAEQLKELFEKELEEFKNEVIRSQSFSSARKMIRQCRRKNQITMGNVTYEFPKTKQLTSRIKKMKQQKRFIRTKKKCNKRKNLFENPTRKQQKIIMSELNHP